MQLSVRGTPVVLTNTPFDSWTATHWTPQSLAQAAERREMASQVLSKRGAKHVFLYHAADQPLSSIDAISSPKSYKEIIYPSEKYFTLLQEPFDGYYYYSSGGIELLHMDSFFSEESLKTLTFSQHLQSFSSLGQVNYWLGKPNVTAYTHYDTSYNLHAVMYGQKKFIIFPPEAYRDLGLYPCLHQLYRQVQTDIFDPELSAMIEGLNGVEVLVNPGEVLYIPPYWFHSVVTMKTTISFNVWSQSEAFVTMEDVYASAIPFEEEWGTKKLMKALNYFVMQLLQELLPPGDVGGYVRDRVYSRYKPFQAALEAIVKENARNTVDELCLRTDIGHLLTSEQVSHIDVGVAKIAGLLKTIEPQPVLEINLANYIEHLVWRILGTNDIALLPFYLQSCF